VTADADELIACARGLAADGLLPGTSGNLSVRARHGEGALVTPSGRAWASLGAHELVRLADDGRVLGPARGKPTSEWRLHLAVYAAFPAARAIVHTHSRFATALSCLRRDLPAVHYMIAVAGGATVRCARYATYGSAELAAACVEALADRRACLLANHGLIAWGEDLAGAERVAREIELVAEHYLRASAAGTPVILPDEEIARVAEQIGASGYLRANVTGLRPRR
jgi:L-fuculose-phosphate aldolase